MHRGCGTNNTVQAKSRKYQGVFEVKSRVKACQVRGIWSQQLEHKQVPQWGTEPGVRKGKRSLLACHTRCKCNGKQMQTNAIANIGHSWATGSRGGTMCPGEVSIPSLDSCTYHECPTRLPCMYACWILHVEDTIIWMLYNFGLKIKALATHDTQA